MSLKSDSITWQSWARNGAIGERGFQRMGVREQMQRDLRFRVVAVEKPLEKVQKRIVGFDVTILTLLRLNNIG